MTLIPFNIKKKTIVLLSPPLEGKKEFIFDCMLSRLKKGSPFVLILTDDSPEQLKEELNKKNMNLDNYEQKGLLYYIDCYSKHTGLKTTEHPNIRRVSGPIALNEISIVLSELKEKLLKQNDSFCVLFTSLSTLLMYSNISTIARFIPQFISKVKESDGNIMFTLEQGMHDDTTVATIEHFADIILEIKMEKEKILVKARGLEDYKDWTELKL